MRKLVVVGVLLGIAACSPAPDGAEASATSAEAVALPLPSFEFRGLKPGITTTAEAETAGIVGGCMDHGSCYFNKLGVGDVGTGRSVVVFTNGKFDWFTVKMSPNSFEAMGRTLSSVYGPPCREDSRLLQNAFGATFSGDETEWCFAEGHLTLRRHSENDVTEGELDFFTYREAAPAKDYNSGNL